MSSEISGCYYFLFWFVVLVADITSAKTVTIKWGKEVYKNVTIDPSEGVDIFKMKVFSLTSVPPERQKSRRLFFFFLFVHMFLTCV